MSYSLKPMNKYVVIEPIDEPTKTAGGLFMPGNVTNQYRSAKLIALSECDEARGMNVGDIVLYDTLGAISHRIGNQTITTVKVLNILGVVGQEQNDTDALAKAIVETHG